MQKNAFVLRIGVHIYLFPLSIKRLIQRKAALHAMYDLYKQLNGYFRIMISSR
jgi:hypothetical protein